MNMKGIAVSAAYAGKTVEWIYQRKVNVSYWL